MQPNELKATNCAGGKLDGELGHGGASEQEEEEKKLSSRQQHKRIRAGKVEDQ